MLIPSDDIVKLSDLGIEDKKEVGEELSLLGELAYNGVPFAPSFVITPDAFINFKSENNLHTKIKHLLGSMNTQRKDSVIQISSYIKDQIRKSPFSDTFTKKIFKEYENIERKTPKVNLTLTTFYLHNGSVIKKGKIENVTGESSLTSHVREIWSYIFEHRLLSLNELTHENHHSYGVAIMVSQKNSPQFSGYIRTTGEKNEKHQHIIEATDHVKLTFDKTINKVNNGVHLNNKWQDLISVSDLKKLINIAQIADKKLYHPYFLKWQKEKEIIITEIVPVTLKTDYYSKLESLKGIPVHPGIRVGRVRLVEKNHEAVTSNEEVVIVKTLTKSILDSIRKATAIISEDDLHEELKFYIKQRGIPAITVKDAFKSFKNGEIVSVDATNGEVKHGSILIS